jgi:hypothetical protein
MGICESAQLGAQSVTPSQTMKRAGLAMALVGLATGGIIAGCGADSNSRVGQVTTLSPRLCVGRHAATGTCFVAKSPQILTTLHIGECVEVTFTPPQDGAGPSLLETIKSVEAKRHSDDCPG